MDIQNLAAIIFIIILGFALLYQRKKLHVQKIAYPLIYILMYKTKIGLISMEKAARKIPYLKYIGYAGIFIGFIGMGIISYSLIENLFKVFLVPKAESAVALVLPFKVKGAFFVPFFYWIISIFIIVIVHEFSHGVMSRFYNLRIKSSGLAFLGLIIPILPAAFVEPDEKKLAKKPIEQQLSIFAAGSFSNIMLAIFLAALLFFAVSPLVESITEYDGVLVTGFPNETTSPLKEAGMQEYEVITSIDNITITMLENISSYLMQKKPGDKAKVQTNRTSYIIELGKNPQNESVAYLGAYMVQSTKTKSSFEQKYGLWLDDVIYWTAGLIIWLFLLNLGIGLFNLAPIPICDGGRMFYISLLSWFEEKKAQQIWKYVSLFFVLLIIINVSIGFMK
ncbi:MAG: site-2 protease family protein [Candidatus Woesearchaeota archaeon]|nr:site-2 protease family protein [Candidatus Woesearchaeota archaeon]